MYISLEIYKSTMGFICVHSGWGFHGANDKLFFAHTIKKHVCCFIPHIILALVVRSHFVSLFHYNKKGAYCDPNIIANNKEISFRKPVVPNNNSSQTLKPLRKPHLRTRTIASFSQLPKLNQSQNISDYNVFYT
jgi:hypothetical protein